MSEKKFEGVTEFISKRAGNWSMPMKVLVPMLVTLLGATWHLSAQFADVKAEFKEMQREIWMVTDKAWTKDNQELWGVKLQRDNPALHVPPADEGIMPKSKSANASVTLDPFMAGSPVQPYAAAPGRIAK